MEKADGFAAVVTRVISKSAVACTPLGGLHNCEWADYVVRFVVTVVLGATFPVSALIKTLRRLPTIPRDDLQLWPGCVPDLERRLAAAPSKPAPGRHAAIERRYVTRLP